MANNIIDLSLFVKDPLIFRDLKGTEYNIPGNVKTEFVLKFSKYEQESVNVNSPEESIEKMQQMVVDILKLDSTMSKKITMKYVQERFDSLDFLAAIIFEFGKHIKNLKANPN